MDWLQVDWLREYFMQLLGLVGLLSIWLIAARLRDCHRTLEGIEALLKRPREPWIADK
jgi:hypothetical protein